MDICISFGMKEINIQELANSADMKQLLASYVENEIFHVVFDFSSDFTNAKTLRDAVDAICNIMGLDSKWKTRMVLIVDELSNNAIEYGSSSTDTNKLEVYVAKLKDTFDIKISVQDSGNGTQAKTATEMENIRKDRLEKWFTDHSSIRGRGLFMIISNLVDKLHFKDSSPKWLVVEVTKKLPIEK